VSSIAVKNCISEPTEPTNHEYCPRKIELTAELIGFSRDNGKLLRGRAALIVDGSY
jgi:hypothetical protein